MTRAPASQAAILVNTASFHTWRGAMSATHSRNVELSGWAEPVGDEGEGMGKIGEISQTASN